MKKSTLTKNKIGNLINKAIMASNAGLNNFGLVDIETLFTKVQFKYCGKLGGQHMFALVDISDPYSGQSHGYPKFWDGDLEAFWREFNRELNYIDEIHNDNEEMPF